MSEFTVAYLKRNTIRWEFTPCLPKRTENVWNNNIYRIDMVNCSAKYVFSTSVFFFVCAGYWKEVLFSCTFVICYWYVECPFSIPSLRHRLFIRGFFMQSLCKAMSIIHFQWGECVSLTLSCQLVCVDIFHRTASKYEVATSK